MNQGASPANVVRAPGAAAPFRLSIVATLYQSEPYVAEFCERAAGAARSLFPEFEIILVNDGSPDGSLRVAKQYADSHERVTIIDLSRNFGHAKAIMAGLQHCQGDLVFLIDSDLEEEPEWLVDFWRSLNENDADVVYGVQGKRRGGFFDRLSGAIYYRLFRALTGLAIPFNLVTARLMTRRYVQALTCFEERELDIAGLWAITGFHQVSHSVKKHSTSPTTYTFAKKMNLLVDSITSFSNAPLIAIFYFGLLVSAVAAAFTCYLIVNRYVLDTPLSGWTSVMASVWLLGGLMISFVGVIGIYLAKVFSEAKRRPNTIVREIYPKSRAFQSGS
jgi:putative glycosyltransferase